VEPFATVRSRPEASGGGTGRGGSRWVASLSGTGGLCRQRGCGEAGTAGPALRGAAGVAFLLRRPLREGTQPHGTACSWGALPHGSAGDGAASPRVGGLRAAGARPRPPGPASGVAVPDGPPAACPRPVSSGRAGSSRYEKKRVLEAERVLCQRGSVKLVSLVLLVNSDAVNCQ